MLFNLLLKFDLSLITGDEVLIMVIGYLVVFVVLILLYVVFQNLPKLILLATKARDYQKNGRKTLIQASGNPADKKTSSISGELNAAISAAIHLYADDHHDEEATILTIEKVSKLYSPWSSKIYSVTNLRR